MIQSITGSLVGYILAHKWLLTIFNFLLPLAVYFETGPVSAFATYIGYFLVVSLAMHMKREADMKDAMHEALGPILKKVANKEMREGTLKNGDKFQSIKIDLDNLDNLDDLDEKIKEQIDKVTKH